MRDQLDGWSDDWWIDNGMGRQVSRDRGEFGALVKKRMKSSTGMMMKPRHCPF